MLMSPKADLIPTGKRLILRFWQSASGFWRTPRAWALIIFLISIMLLQLLVYYQLNFWNRDFFNAVERKDETAIWVQAIRFVPFAAGSLALAIGSVWARMTTKRKWREWLSSRLYDDWLEHGDCHQLQFMPGKHQTPEYRIAEDAKVATELPIDLLLGLLWSILSATTFMGILWSVGGDLPIAIFGIALTIPKYLVIAVVVYSIFVTGATIIIGRRLTKVTEESKRTEAELRSIGANLRESCEATTLPNSKRNGRNLIGTALDQVIAKWLALCWQNMRMTLVSHTNFLVSPILALLLCMPKYVAEAMTLGDVIQAAAAFVLVQSAFNWITDSYVSIAEWTSSANRVASLLVAIDQIERPK
jgi:vitamin B12/bleomycin/antimicrobial peptide transport system ATP-binding/permease protein